jgi:hypothetical protein
MKMKDPGKSGVGSFHHRDVLSLAIFLPGFFGLSNGLASKCGNDSGARMVSPCDETSK